MMMSRPHSPFKRGSRPPSQSSPGRSSPTRHFRSNSVSDDQSPKAYLGADESGPSSSRYGLTGSGYSAVVSRAEHYDVVVEGKEANAILPHLGAIVLDQLGSMDEGDRLIDEGFPTMLRTGSSLSINAIQKAERPQGSANTSSTVSNDRFESMLLELVQTERSYVRRIETLYQRYALPLRQLARDRDTAIIPLYEAQRLFGNVGEVLAANSAFIKDLESFVEARRKGTTNVSLGDLVFRNMTCFSCYNEYLSNFEKAKHIEQTMMKSNRAFREFVERTKGSTTGLGNVGLRELIMEPVQRIPRYTMLLDGLVRNLPTMDPSRGRLEEAIVLASRIASCEVDDKTKRAAVHWSLARNIDGFPAGLISVHRQFIDCIDVDDFPIDVLGPAAMSGLLSPSSISMASPSHRTLHCTLFLFDDVIVIAKRASSSSCGRFLVGLDDLNKLADQMKTFTERSSSASRANQKIELGFRGLIDLPNVQAIDLGGPDLQLCMSKAPSHATGEKWASRLTRQYATNDASSISGPDPALARSEKQRFLENLWRAQALLKAKDFRSHVRSCVIPSSAGEDKIRRVIYWNIYSRRSYLGEPHKSVAVLHVDPSDEADQLPFGYESAPPAAIVRIHGFDKIQGWCHFTHSFKGRIKGQADDRWNTSALSALSDKLYEAAKEAGFSSSDFEPKSGNSPSTPASSHRGRNLATGLEQFGRSLFGTPNSMRSTGTGSDIFGTKRSKGSSNLSRNTSISTRITSSTANTSSIGSRDMLRSQRVEVPGSDGVTHSVEKYRQMGGEDNSVTPRKVDHDSASPPLNASTQGSPSPRRKAVPSLVPTSPQRIPSGSKRTLPIDATPTEKPCKRAASGQMYNKEEERGESVSPSLVRRPNGADVDRNNTVVPLRIRKDNGQAKQMTRVERVHSTWKDLDTLREAVVHSRAALRDLQLRSGLKTDEIAQEQENAAETILRLKENLALLLDESSIKAATSIVPTHDASATIKLQAQVSQLTRKCEVLKNLENDGRMENTMLHKAFNEELDQMFEDAGLGEVEQIAKLRAEVKKAKSQRNEANMENKSLQRELALERAQGEVWKALLESNGIL